MHLDGYSLFSRWADRRNNGICDARYLRCSLPVVRLQALLLTSHLRGGLSGARAFWAWQTAHSSALLLRTVSLLPAQAILLTLVLLLLLVPLYTFPLILRSNQSSYFYYKPPPKTISGEFQGPLSLLMPRIRHHAELMRAGTAANPSLRRGQPAVSKPFSGDKRRL